MKLNTICVDVNNKLLLFNEDYLKILVKKFNILKNIKTM
jgi:hypothetical protein